MLNGSNCLLTESGILADILLHRQFIIMVKAEIKSYNLLITLKFIIMRNLRNSVQLIGRIGDDPKIFNFDSGSKKVSFSLATDESYKKDGEKVESTEWHNIVSWGAQAGVVEKYLKKGALIAVEGRLTTNRWEDKEGKKQYRTEISLNDFTFLDSKKKTN